MSTTDTIASLSNPQLLAGLRGLVERDRLTTRDLFVHIGEVDARKLYLAQACSSMFKMCVDRLHMSEDVAWRRIRVARAAREFPCILQMVASGDLHLTGAALLAPFLTPENAEELLAAARHQSKRGIERMLAERFPGTSRPDQVRQQQGDVRAVIAQKPGRTESPTGSELNGDPLTEVEASQRAADAAVNRDENDRGSVQERPSAMSCTTVHERAMQTENSVASADPDVPARIGSPSEGEAERSIPQAEREQESTMSTARYEVRFTADQRTMDLLTRAQALMRHSVPDGNLNDVVARAFSLLVDSLERRQFGATSAQREQNRGEPDESTAKEERVPDSTGEDSTTHPRSRHVPNAIRRQVFERDGARCAFVDPSGHRCTEIGFLQLHHHDPYSLGGDHAAGTVSVFCAQHNRFVAEKDLGREHLDKVIGQRSEARSGAKEAAQQVRGSERRME